MSNKQVKVPSFDTIYKKLDDYVSVDKEKEKGHSKNEMSSTTIYNAFTNELRDIKTENGTFDDKAFDFLEKSWRHTAQQRDLKFSSNNKEFLREVYTTFLREDIELANKPTFSMDSTNKPKQSKKQGFSLKM